MIDDGEPLNTKTTTYSDADLKKKLAMAEQQRAVEDAASKAAIDEANRFAGGRLRGIGGGAASLNPEMLEHRRHLDLHVEHAEKQAKLFVEHCRELVELGATSVMMFGCQATFERK